MALTPEDVRNKQFSTAKRKGYEMDEVDSFLDQVELELGNLARENAELKGRVAAAEQAAAAAAAAAAPASPVPVAPAVPDVNEQAVAMLALAQKTADEHKSRAKAESDALLASAHAKVTELERAGAAERAGLERRVEELRAFEREYRTRLRQHHEAALKELEHRGTDSAPAAGAPGASVPAETPHAAPVPQLAPPSSAPVPQVAPPASAPVPQSAPPAPQAAPPGASPAAPSQGAPSAPQQTPAPSGPQTPPSASPFAVPHDETPPQQA